MRFLWSSDHHTLHPNTPTGHILANLNTFFYRDHDLAKVDLAVFGGDFFEDMVERPNPNMFKVEEWATKFLQVCHKQKTTVIFLEGTSSHDRGQPAHLQFNAPEGMDFHYIDTLCVKTFPQWGDLSVMFVPDNMGKLTPDDIWERALEVLREAKLEKVDLIFFHGAFEFQLVSQVRHKAHNLERWESIVKYAIFAGHIHTPVRKGKLITSGSFDRTAHGEEHPKGGYCVDLDKAKDKFEAVFWENKKALPYLTLTVTPEITPEALLTESMAFIRNKLMPPGSHLRIKGGVGDIVNPIISALEQEFPLIKFKADNLPGNNIEITEDLFDASVYEGVTIDKKNIVDAIMPEIKTDLVKRQIPEAEALAVLKEFL